jgi:hypothetical protein
MEYNVTFAITNGDNPIENASVTINEVTHVTDINGEVVFSLEANEDIGYEIVAEGYITVNDVFSLVDSDIVIPITMEAVVVEPEPEPEPIPNEPMMVYKIQLNRNYILQTIDTKLQNLKSDFESTAIDITLFNGVENKLFDLTDMTVNLSVKLSDNTVINKQATIIDATNGVCRFLLSQDVLNIVGKVFVVVSLVDGTGDKLTIGTLAYGVLADI